MENEIRIIEVEKDEWKTAEELVQITFGVTNEWHCPIMLSDEVLVDPGDGVITMGMTTRQCLVFGSDGKLDDSESCEFCEGIVWLNRVDLREECGMVTNAYTKCSYNQNKFSSSDIDSYLKGIRNKI